MSASKQDLDFKVLSLLSKERGVYGLRNGDYERYRKHCANKIHRLRQVTQLTSGKGKVYKKPPVISDSSVKDARQLQLLLFSAERALAHCHGLKAMTTKPNYASSTRKDQLSWLRRAYRVSGQLFGISTSLASVGSLSQRTAAELAVYHLSIRAELAFERGQWAEALTDLAARRRLLGIMADSAKDSYDQALSAEFIDAYDPLIRFGAYKLGRAESHDIDGVVRDIDADMMEEAIPGFAKLVDGLRADLGSAEIEQGRMKLQDVEFAGEKIEFRSAEIVGVMVKVQDVLSKVGKGKSMKGWDRVLGVLGEAESVARRLLDDHEASASATSLRSTSTSKSLTTAHQYIVFLLLSHRIRRDLLLIDTLKSASIALPEDVARFKVPGGKARLEEAVKTLAAVIKLYDTVLQSLGQLRDLAIVEEKDGVRAGVEGLEAYFHATKCATLARLHCIHPTPSYASAVQLLTRAARSLQKAQSLLVDPDFPIQEPVLTLSPKALSQLESDLAKLDLAAKRALFAERVQKPVFFDTAFNYVELPLDELLVRAGKADAASSSAGQSSIAGAVSDVAQKVAQAAADVAPKKAVEAVKAVSRTTRESTPAVESRPEVKTASARQQEQDQQDETPGTPSKGWLGGWFGRGKA